MSQNPLTPEQYARRKAVEQARKAVDPAYITAEEAGQLPPEAMTDPLVRARVESSARHWPENDMPTSSVFTDLPEGEGGTVERYKVPAESLFRGGPAGDGGD